MKRIHVKSAPVNIALLIKNIGDVRASAALGVTPSAMNKWLRVGKAPKAAEIAAQSLCQSNTNKVTTAVITGDQELLDTIERVIMLGNGDFKLIK